MIVAFSCGRGQKLATISYVRHKYMDSPFPAGYVFKVLIGGVLVLLTGIIDWEFVTAQD